MTITQGGAAQKRKHAARDLWVFSAHEPVSYMEAWDLQKRLLEERLLSHIPDTLLLLEHKPVITYNGHSPAENRPLSTDEYERRGYECIQVDRGGDVTLHAPGQVIGYPIIFLGNHQKDVRWYLRALEDVLIALSASYNLCDVGRVDGRTGVWVGGRKIASIGVRIRKWVTMHGFAYNWSTDLSRFDNIVPCGISGVKMTSLEHEMSIGMGAGLPSRTALDERIANFFSDRFSLHISEWRDYVAALSLL